MRVKPNARELRNIKRERVNDSKRFEGISDPADEGVVYASSSTEHDVKGTLVNGYGIYSDSLSDHMMRALEIKGR